MNGRVSSERARETARRPRTGTTVAALAFVSLCAAVPAHAGEATSNQELAHRIVTVTQENFDVSKMMRAMGQAMEQQMLANIRQKNPALTQEQSAHVAATLTTAVQDGLDEMLTRVKPKIYAAVEAMYAEKFTAAELTEILRFQTSDAGKKLRTVMQEDLPHRIASVMADVGPQNAIQEHIQAAVKSLAKEMRLNGVDGASAREQ